MYDGTVASLYKFLLYLILSFLSLFITFFFLSSFFSLSLWFLVYSLLSLKLKPIFSNPKSYVVVVATEVGVSVDCNLWWWHGFLVSGFGVVCDGGLYLGLWCGLVWVYGVG